MNQITGLSDKTYTPSASMAHETTLVVGASSALAQSYIEQVANEFPGQHIVAFSRRPAPANITTFFPQVEWWQTDYQQESLRWQIEACMDASRPLARVAIFNGVLHDEEKQPEKRIEDIDPQKITSLLQVNAVLPVIVLQTLMPFIARRQKCTLAVLSARVGSISDNQLGGWYSYRAGKAALNMLLKTTAIEMARRCPEAKLIAFHPGTTDSPLSKPFQQRVPDNKLFTPDFVAGRLVQVMQSAPRDRQLSYLDWDNKSIDW